MSICKICNGSGVDTRRTILYTDGTAPPCGNCNGKGTEPESLQQVLQRHGVRYTINANGIKVKGN